MKEKIINVGENITLSLNWVRGKKWWYLVIISTFVFQVAPQLDDSTKEPLLKWAPYSSTYDPVGQVTQLGPTLKRYYFLYPHSLKAQSM